MLLCEAVDTHTARRIRTSLSRLCLPDVLPSVGCHWQPASREPPPVAGFKMGAGSSATCCRPAPSLGGVGPSEHAIQWLMSEELTACLCASNMIKRGGVMHMDTCQAQTGIMHTWLRLIAWQCHDMSNHNDQQSSITNAVAAAADPMYHMPSKPVQ